MGTGTAPLPGGGVRGPPEPPPRASVTLVPLLRHHPPGRTDKIFCRCFGALVFFFFFFP